MKEYRVKILKKENLNHDVRLFRIEKPKGYKFISGQSVMVSIDKPKWKDKKRAFTISSTNDDKYIDFTIKIYAEHKGVTLELDKTKEGDKLLIGEAFGMLTYNKNGVFIAGGCGVAPFISIFRELNKTGKLEGNTFIYTNKTEEDIVYRDELKSLLGKDCHFVLTREKKKEYINGRINEKLIMDCMKNKESEFYVCGPHEMVVDVKEMIKLIKSKIKVNSEERSLEICNR